MKQPDHKRPLFDLKREPPEWIGPYGLAIWQELAPSLVQQGILSENDRLSFEQLCFLGNEFRVIQDQIQREGRTVPDRSGSIKKHPLLSEQKAILFEFQKSLKQFGLSPASSGHLLSIQKAATETEEPNPFEELLNTKFEGPRM